MTSTFTNKCGHPNCRYRAKNYGVCGHHKDLAFKSTDPEFQKDLQQYKIISDRYYREGERLESIGINILEMQAIWGYNLCGPEVNPVPERFKEAYEAVKAMGNKVAEMQAKYNPDLVYNSTVRINHKQTPIQNCCLICDLQ